MMRVFQIWKTTVDDTDPEKPIITRMGRTIRRRAQCLPLGDDLLIEILGFASGTMAFWCQLKHVSRRFKRCAQNPRTFKHLPLLLDCEPRSALRPLSIGRFVCYYPTQLTLLNAVDWMLEMLYDSGLIESPTKLELKCAASQGRSATHCVTDAGLALLGLPESKFGLLQDLVLANCQKLTNKCIQTLGQFKHLRVLDISGCIEITDCGIRELPVTLRELSLARLGITATGMQSLKSLDQLLQLNLAFCTGVTDAGLEWLPPGLQVLCLKGCEQVTDRGVVAIRRRMSGSLQVLDLTDCTLITSDSVCVLSHGMVRLRWLSLHGCIAICYFEDLGLPGLHTSIGAMQRITARDIASLSRLTALRELDMSGCTAITDVELKSIQCLMGMQRLKLAGCTLITDNGMETLAQMRVLAELDVSRCGQITDWGVSALPRLMLLRDVNISDCVLVTDVGARWLSLVGALRNVNLSGCLRITASGVSDLLRTPGMAVTWPTIQQIRVWDLDCV